MRDAVSIQRAQLLHPKIRQAVIDTIDKVEANLPKNAKVRLAQTLRDEEEQNAIYAQGRTKPGPIVTKAKFGQSFHGYGLAWDFAIMYDKDNNGNFECLSWNTKFDFDKDGIADWMEVVNAFKAWGCKWGGDFSSIQDDPHIEKTFGYTWQQL